MLTSIRSQLGLGLEREAFFSHTRGTAIPLNEVTAQPGAWDVYCVCWTKQH